MAKLESETSLLFGILALQNGLIEPADLIAAFQCWLKQRSRHMAQILVERGALSESDHAMLDGLVRRFFEKRGDHDEGSVSAGPAHRAPDGDDRRAAGPDRGRRAAPARERASSADEPPNLGGLTVGVGNQRGDPDEVSDWSFSLGQPTAEGGRFQLLRHHARGGIGLVSVAMDRELHREVALKQIQPRHADDPSSRARFLLEAEVTGRLEHPGVVPVYGLGAGAEGRPFYAMRFVRGQSLKEAVERFHAADRDPSGDPALRAVGLRRLLRRFVDVCNAVAYAHSRGVLHRDLKPANILLGPYGETLVVDWGLAKVVGRDDPAPRAAAEVTLRPASQSGSSDTVAGTAIGTPAYMSPEQAEGRMAQLGPASDVYSLGATLYCLVAGKPPLEDGDVQEMVRKVRQGAIAPPRQVNARAPAPLEAIVLKAMALDPGSRYPSAHALAEEVERWLADEPILARREPVWERARRWMRRRKSAVAAMSAAMIATLVGLVAVLAVQTRANAQLKSANFELAEANGRTLLANNELQRANARERARFDLALEAIKTFHGGVSADLLLKERQFDGLRAKLLGGATDFYKRIEGLLLGQADHRSRAALAQAYHDVGELTAKIGSPAQALGLLRRGMELRLALAAEPESGVSETLAAGASLLAIGDLQEATGEVAAALQSYERARSLLEPLARTRDAAAEYRAAAARCLHGIARVQYHAGRAAESLASHDQARAIRQALAVAEPSIPEFQSDLAVSYHEIGTIERAQGRAAAALASYGRALAIRQKLALADPADPQRQSDLAQSHSDIGILRHETGDLARALESLEQSRDILQQRAQANPAVTKFEGDLAQSYQTIGSVQSDTGHPDLALVSYTRARAILRKLADSSPTVTLFQSRLAMSHAYVGLERRRSGRPADASAEFRQAVAIMDRLCTLQPNGYNLYNLACFRSLLAGIAAEPGSGMTAADVDILGEQAVATLRRAVSAGLRDVAFMRKDSDLDALRLRPDFQMLLMDLAVPEQVFAR